MGKFDSVILGFIHSRDVSWVDCTLESLSMIGYAAVSRYVTDIGCSFFELANFPLWNAGG